MAQGVTYDGIPLMITNVGDESSIISLTPYGSFNARIYYKQDNDKFYKKWNYNAITLPPNSTLSLFGDSSSFSSSTTKYANFSITGSSVKLSGRLASISDTKGVTYTYYSLFRNCTSVVEVSSDFLEGVLIPTSGYAGSSIFSYLFSNTGITQVPEGFFDFREPVITIYACLSVYEYMFKDCKSLVSVPQSIFEKETYICQKQYQGMFSGCSALTQAPDIYATNAPWLCCSGMFYNCESLENPPQIACNGYSDSSAFSSMFQGCTSLKQAPTMYDLIKDGGPSSQHTGMFKNCTSLNYVEVSFTQWKIYNSDNDRLYSHTLSWLANVSPTGTFVCPKKLAEATDGYYDEEGNFVAGVGRGVDTVPEGWYIDYPIIDARDGNANAVALMSIISQQTHADGTPWVKDSLVMMKSEAEKVENIGTAFSGKFKDGGNLHRDFSAFKYFTNPNFTKIPASAFESCWGLEKIILPPQITSIGNRAFYYITLAYIEIPDEVTYIGSWAFYLCMYLPSIKLPESVTTLNGMVLSRCQRLALPDLSNITTIGGQAFSENPFTSFHVHSGMTSLARGFLGYQSKITSLTVDEDNPKYISENNCIIDKSANLLLAAANDSSIPDWITDLGQYAFNRRQFTSKRLVIPSSVTVIRNYCIQSTNLEILELSATPIRLENAAISNNGSLKTLICRCTTPHANIENNRNDSLESIYVPDDRVDAYKTSWSIYADIIKPLTEYTPS